MNETARKKSKPRGTCGWCGQSWRTDAAGTLRLHPGLDGTACDGTGATPVNTTAPVPRGRCGACLLSQKLTRETGLVLRHGDCPGAGAEPTERITATDRRRRLRPDAPVLPAPQGADLATRDEVAEICGVTVRTVTRWADAGYLTRYEDSRGRVAYARVQAEAMNRFEPVE